MAVSDRGKFCLWKRTSPCPCVREKLHQSSRVPCFGTCSVSQISAPWVPLYFSPGDFFGSEQVVLLSHEPPAAVWLLWGRRAGQHSLNTSPHCRAGPAKGTPASSTAALCHLHTDWLLFPSRELSVRSPKGTTFSDYTFLQTSITVAVSPLLWPNILHLLPLGELLTWQTQCSVWLQAIRLHWVKWMAKYCKCCISLATSVSSQAKALCPNTSWWKGVLRHTAS